MTLRSIAAIAATVGGCLCLITQPAAQNTSNNALRVLVSNGMKGTMEALQPQCEQAVGRPLAIQFGWEAISANALSAICPTTVATSATGRGSHSTFVPSQLPSGVAPKHAATAGPTRGSGPREETVRKPSGQRRRQRRRC